MRIERLALVFCLGASPHLALAAKLDVVQMPSPSLAAHTVITSLSPKTLAAPATPSQAAAFAGLGRIDGILQADPADSHGLAQAALDHIFTNARWTAPEARSEYDQAQAPKAAEAVGAWKQVASATDSTVQDYRRLLSDASLDLSDSLQVTLDEGAGPYQGTINELSLDFSLSAHRRFPHAEAWDTVAYACRMAGAARMICVADWNYARRMMNHERTTGRQLIYLAFERRSR